jgi:hypothetical protein
VTDVKRFLDIRWQAADYRFCVFDETSGQIETHAGNTAWRTFDEFARDCPTAEKYQDRAPAWVFEAPAKDVPEGYDDDEEFEEAPPKMSLTLV